MINAIVKGIFKLVTKFINILLIPINLLITNMLPGFSNMLSYVSNFFNSIFNYVGFIMNSFLIDTDVISFLILYWTFRLTFPYAVSLVKLVVKWYDKLKL